PCLCRGAPSRRMPRRGGWRSSRRLHAFAVTSRPRPGPPVSPGDLRGASMPLPWAAETANDIECLHCTSREVHAPSLHQVVAATRVRTIHRLLVAFFGFARGARRLPFYHVNPVLAHHLYEDLFEFTWGNQLPRAP